MADRILYTIPEMNQAGQNFISKAGEIEEILDYLQQEIYNLEPVFDGAAQDALFEKYDELSTKLKEFPEVIDKIGNLIIDVAKNMEEYDMQMAEEIKK